MLSGGRLVHVQQTDEADVDVEHLRHEPFLLSDGTPSPSSSEAAAAARHPGSHSSLSSATLTLAVAAAGAGMLSFGYATRVQGMASTVTCTILFAALNAYTMAVVARMTQAFRHRLEGQGSYDELVRACLGPRQYVFCLANIFVGSIGSLTSYLIICGSLGHQAMWQACTTLDPATGEVLVNHCGFWSSRTAVVLVLALFVIFPLTFLRKLHHMRVSTWICFGTVVSVAAIVVVRGLEAVAASDYPSTPGQRAVDTSEGLFLRPHLEFFLGAPIAIFSLGCHVQVPLVTLELVPQARARLVSHVIPTTNALTCLLYLATGLFGFVTFGSETDGNLLLNYAPRDVAATVAKALMALHISLAFPVCLHPAREALDGTLRYLWRIEPCALNTLVQSVACLALATCFAIVIPQVEVVFGLLGATIGVSIGFYFPGLMVLRMGKTAHDRWMGLGLMAFSATMLVLGTSATVYSQFF